MRGLACVQHLVVIRCYVYNLNTPVIILLTSELERTHLHWRHTRGAPARLTLLMRRKTHTSVPLQYELLELERNPLQT